MALGAARRDVFGMVVGHGLRLVGLGIAIGTVCALAATRLISAQLYGVSASDPLTFIVDTPACTALVANPARRLWPE